MKSLQCPECHAQVQYPDKPERKKFGGRTIITNILCEKCASTMAFFEDTGALCAHVPGRVNLAGKN